MRKKIIHDFKSPNFAQQKLAHKYIILHCMCMQDKQAVDFLCSKENGVSAHYYIARNGDIYSLVDDCYIAWHAGVSSWKNDDKLNQNSIGIELGNKGKLGSEGKYTKKQYASLISLIKHLQKKYLISPKNVLAHSDIAPDRKTDPGALFNWSSLIEKNIAVDFYADKKADYLQTMANFGYNFIKYQETDIVKAFQRRFIQDNISGILDDKTKNYIDKKRCL